MGKVAETKEEKARCFDAFPHSRAVELLISFSLMCQAALEVMLREQRAMEQMKVVEKKEAVQAMHREMREKRRVPARRPIWQWRVQAAEDRLLLAAAVCWRRRRLWREYAKTTSADSTMRWPDAHPPVPCPNLAAWSRG